MKKNAFIQQKYDVFYKHVTFPLIALFKKMLIIGLPG